MAEPGANPGGEARGLAHFGKGEAAADLLYTKVDVDCGVIVAFLSLLLMLLLWLLIVAAAAAYLREAKKCI